MKLIICYLNVTQGYESIPIKETVMEEIKVLIQALYKRIELEVDSLAMQNKLCDELEYADSISDEEECMYYIRRVENTLDTLDTD